MEKKEVTDKGIIEKKEIVLIKRIIFFLVASVFLVLLGSVSYYVYSKYLYNPVLLAPGDTVNVYVVDSGMGIGTVSNSILFEGEWSSLQETQIPSSLPQIGSKPFVIVNAGTVPADIEITSTGNKLFSDSSSLFQFRVHSYKFNEVLDGSGYEKSARDCFDSLNNPLCFVSTPCSDWCDFSFDVFTKAIYGLQPDEVGDGYGDGAIIEVRINSAVSELPGPKSTIIQLKGIESG